LLKMYINHYQIQDLVKKVSDQIQDTSKSIYSFLSEIISQDKYHADILFSALNKFKPCLIINKAVDQRDEFLGQSIVNVVQKYLVVKLNYLGAIPMDERVPHSLKNLYPYICKHDKTEVAHSLHAIAEKLINSRSSQSLF